MNTNFDKEKLQRLSLRDDSGKIICELWPINRSFDVTDEIVELLVKWRNKSMKYFKTQFNASPDTTKQWLQNNIAQNNRVLFLIFIEGKPVGHYGLSNILEDSAELDNAIRGERDGAPDLFIEIEKYLIKFCFEQLKLRSLSAKVFSNNFLALAMHQKFGFEVAATYPLRLVETEGKKEFIECEDQESNVSFAYIELKLINNQ